MSDMYHEQDRGKSLAIASFLPYLGPALGPIFGGLLTQLVHWHWIFWIMSIFNSAITMLGLIFIRESYVPVLLRRKAIKCAHQVPSQVTAATTTPRSPNMFTQLRKNLARPVRLLLTRPVIQVIALLLALDFGIYAFLLSTFATLYIERYQQSAFTASLHYISIAIGSTLSAQVGGHIMDSLYRRLKDKSPSRQGKPEFRAPWMVPGTLLVPVGLLWYGWTAESRQSWISVDFGAAVFSLGSFSFSQALLAYQLDEFGAEYGAAANAASRVLSNLLAFVFPVFAPRLYGALGWGWGNSLLAGIWLVLVGPVPLVFWLWGEKLRGWGRDKS